MAYKVIILYQLYMPSYFLGTFTEYPYLDNSDKEIPWISPSWSTLRTLDKSKTRKD